MKDSRTVLLLVVSLLLILVSCALLWTWGYNFNNYTKDKSGTVFIVKDSTTPRVTEKINKPYQDSLREMYAKTVSNLGALDSTWTTADSLKSDLDIKLNDFYKLRNEIAELIKNPANKADL